MKLLSTWLLASSLAVFSFLGDNDKSNFRPYISTNLAQVIMTEDEIDIVEEKCDGSGWITHGDGHRTECPGCSACESKEIELKSIVEPEQEDVKKKESSQESSTSLEDSEFYVYHLGAKWCPPCRTMLKKTWVSKNVKELIKSKKAKLFIYDEADPKHKKFFSYYKVRSYPTVVIVDKEALNKPLYNKSGYLDEDAAIKIINEVLKND